MPFQQTMMPQYRDADADGKIGLRGCMRYFQDVHTWFMHAHDKGNDVIPQRYGAGWIYTRYHVRMAGRPDYTEPLTLTAWMEPYRQPVLVHIDTILSQHGQPLAWGRLETCLFSLTRRRPLRLSAVEFPEDLPEDIPHQVPPFWGLDRSAEGMEERYQRTVRASDIDQNGHMTNLRYIEMFQDAHSGDFWRRLAPTEMELCFVTQCVEGETLSLRSRTEEGRVCLTALHADGSVASVARFDA